MFDILNPIYKSYHYKYKSILYYDLLKINKWNKVIYNFSLFYYFNIKIEIMNMLVFIIITFLTYKTTTIQIQ